MQTRGCIFVFVDWKSNVKKFILLSTAASLLFAISSSCAYRSALIPKNNLPQTVESTPPAPTKQFSIQLAAFDRKERAGMYIDQLLSKGVQAYPVENSNGLWTVRTGPFATIEEARNRGTDLQSQQCIDDFFIVNTKEPAPSAPGAVPGTIQDRIVQTAYGYLGAPYAWGGTSPVKGFDCSGFTMVVYQRCGFELPRSAAAQFRVGEPVSRDSLQKGDLLFFTTRRKDSISHVGIYSGNDVFIHASTHDGCIRTAHLSKSYYKKRYKGARRLVQTQ